MKRILGFLLVPWGCIFLPIFWIFVLPSLVIPDARDEASRRLEGREVIPRDMTIAPVNDGQEPCVIAKGRNAKIVKKDWPYVLVKYFPDDLEKEVRDGAHNVDNECDTGTLFVFGDSEFRRWTKRYKKEKRQMAAVQRLRAGRQ